MFHKHFNSLKGREGILSHFPMADSNNSQTLKQNQKFLRIVESIEADFTKLPDGSKKIVHIANSAAIINFPDTYFNMVRPGIALYGCHPSADAKNRSPYPLTQVMSFKTKVVQLKEVPAGYGLSYGHLFVTKRPSLLAIIPVGYADGYLRSLTDRAEVLIRGQRAPVCGRICMNACVVDVTDISGVEVYDDVVLMGEQSHQGKTAMISADEVAGWMDTISYEVLCLFGNNNQRVYVE